MWFSSSCHELPRVSERVLECRRWRCWWGYLLRLSSVDISRPRRCQLTMHVCWCEEAAPSARVQQTMRACVRKVAGTSCESRMGDPVMEASGWLVKGGWTSRLHAFGCDKTCWSRGGVSSLSALGCGGALCSRRQVACCDDFAGVTLVLKWDG